MKRWNPKDFIKAVEIQKILHLKRPDAKSFAFATHTSKIFSICVRAPTRTLKSPTVLVCAGPADSCVPAPTHTQDRKYSGCVNRKYKIFCISTLLIKIPCL
jgi:hypothetical protein